MKIVDTHDKTVIQSSLFFRQLDEPSLAAVLEVGESKRLEQGEILFSQGEPALRTYLVVSGQVKLTRLSPDGAQTLLRIVRPGQILAIVSAFEVLKFPATATAERDSLLLGWSGKTLDALFLRYPALARNALEIVVQRISEMQDRFGELATEQLEQRLAHALLRLATQLGIREGDETRLDIKLSRQDLAEIVGATLFSVSRVLTGWQECHWVKVGRQKVTLIDLPALKRVSSAKGA